MRGERESGCRKVLAADGHSHESVWTMSSLRY